ncbi:MAG: carbohydrate ABC transporter permease [Candidatus Parvarchaeota archaeon]|nr:carbohydrate ABC transporter permease [Candidatus Jingweiarchaeum tengchongense]MCW1306058.1 carbohydrate ABC transporter permease [Candidatus Jingweiarchaeum tengchongense]
MKKIFGEIKKIQPISLVVLGIFALISLYPLFFTFITSFKNNTEFYANFFGFPSKLRWDNYLPVIGSVLLWLKNSAIYSGITVILVLIVTSLAGYAFARFDFKMKNILFYLMLSTMMLPGILMLPALYIEIVKFNWNNTIWALIFPWTTGSIPADVFILRRFFASESVEVFEAAKIDGASELRILVSIALPLARPILSTIAILSILGTYNDLLWPLIVISKDSLMPVNTGILTLGGGGVLTIGNTFAAYVIAILPMLIVFAFLAKQFVKALTEGIVR